jgi:hypothetical protein
MTNNTPSQDECKPDRTESFVRLLATFDVLGDALDEAEQGSDFTALNQASEAYRDACMDCYFEQKEAFQSDGDLVDTFAEWEAAKANLAVLRISGATQREWIDAKIIAWFAEYRYDRASCKFLGDRAMRARKGKRIKPSYRTINGRRTRIYRMGEVQ